MSPPIGNCRFTTACVLAVVLAGSTDLAWAGFPGDGWYTPHERTLTRGRHGLSPAELAPIRIADDLDTRRTLDGMTQLVSLNVEDMALDQFADTLARKTGLQILLDHRALEEASITAEQAITLQVDQVPLRQALSLALEPLEMTWEAEGKIVLLTSREKAKCVHSTVV